MNFTVHEFAVVKNLDLMVYMGTHPNTAFGTTPDERLVFMRQRYQEIGTQLTQAIANLADMQVIYMKDTGNLCEWYTLEDSFLVYNFVDMDSILDVNLIKQVIW